MTTIQSPRPWHKDPVRPVTTDDVDWPFIQSLEGHQQLKAYVPQVGKSGVTVASGVDLGQILDPNYLGKLGLSPSLTEKLLPYIALRRNDAEFKLLRSPLIITKEEADELDAATFKVMINFTARVYMSSKVPKDYKANPDFLAIPREARTVCASLAWNIGCNLSKAAPKWFGFFLMNRWDLCQRELNNFYMKGAPVSPGLVNRRKAEAKYLEPLTGGNLDRPVVEVLSPLCSSTYRFGEGTQGNHNKYAG